MDKLELLKQQMHDDFEMTWRLMGDNTTKIEATRKEMDRLWGEMAENNRQMVGRMRLMEERFRAVIEAVQDRLANAVPMERILELETRVEALERRPPAA